MYLDKQVYTWREDSNIPSQHKIVTHNTTVDEPSERFNVLPIIDRGTMNHNEPPKKQTRRHYLTLINLCDETVDKIISFLPLDDLRKMLCVSSKHDMMVKKVAFKLSSTKLKALDIL